MLHPDAQKEMMEQHQCDTISYFNCKVLLLVRVKFHSIASMNNIVNYLISHDDAIHISSSSLFHMKLLVESYPDNNLIILHFEPRSYGHNLNLIETDGIRFRL